MADDFIPLNQSTPVSKKWFQGGNTNYNHNNSNSSYQNNRSFRGRNRGGRNNRWGNNSRSFSSDGNNSFGQYKNKIDEYIHPSMLKDPWAKLKQQAEENNSCTNNTNT